MSSLRLSHGQTLAANHMLLFSDFASGAVSPEDPNTFSVSLFSVNREQACPNRKVRIAF